MNKTIQEFCPSAASPECKLNIGLDPLEAFEGLMIKCNAYKPFRIYSKMLGNPLSYHPDGENRE